MPKNLWTLALFALIPTTLCFLALLVGGFYALAAYSPPTLLASRENDACLLANSIENPTPTQFQESIHHCKLWLKENPNNPRAMEILGYYLLEVEEYDQAIPYLIKALEYNPNESTTYLNLGIAYDSKDQPQLALGYFDKAIALNPKLHEAYYARGVIYLDSHRFHQAVHDLEIATLLAPNDGEYLYDLSRGYAALGQCQQSKDAYSKSSTGNPPPVCQIAAIQKGKKASALMNVHDRPFIFREDGPNQD
ncbi:MAG: tetratricopeptide repeat protein [Cyanobacteria bacterium]|nr:tetratricopeptide repeat protein [Cyanobacteriota bacterium]